MRAQLEYFDAIISVRRKGDRKAPVMYQVHTVATSDPRGRFGLVEDIRDWCNEASKAPSRNIYRLDQLEKSGQLDNLVSRLTELDLIDISTPAIRL